MQTNEPRLSDAAAAQILESLLTLGRTSRKRFDGGPDQMSYWLVHMLSQLGPSRNGELAAVCGLDASTVSRQVRQLEDVGIVERHQDPADGRAHLLSLSPDGERRVAEAKSRRLAILSEQLAGWSPHDVATLADLLSRLAREIAPPDGACSERDAAHSPSTDLRQD